MSILNQINFSDYDDSAASTIVPQGNYEGVLKFREVEAKTGKTYVVVEFSNLTPIEFANPDDARTIRSNETVDLLHSVDNPVSMEILAKIYGTVQRQLPEQLKPWREGGIVDYIEKDYAISVKFNVAHRSYVNKAGEQVTSVTVYDNTIKVL